MKIHRHKLNFLVFEDTQIQSDVHIAREYIDLTLLLYYVWTHAWSYFNITWGQR